MLSSLFISAVNHVLDAESWAREALIPHSGKSARLSLPPFDLDFSVSGDGKICPLKEEPDTRIRAYPFSLFRTLSGEIAEIEIRGDAEFAKTLSFLFRNLRWDFEADLGKFTGDVFAHRAAGALNAFLSWQKDAAWNFCGNLAEYWTEERPLLARKDDVSGFVSGVDRLRDDLARLEKRIERLP